MSILSLLAARSMSMRATPACANRFFSSRAQLQVLVQQLRVVLVGEPARPPGLVEPEPESVRMNFLTHTYSSAFAVAGFVPSPRRRARLPARRRRRRPRLRRPLGHFHRQVRHALDDAERAAHRGRADPLHARPLIGEALRDEQPIDVAAEARPSAARWRSPTAAPSRCRARSILREKLQRRERVARRPRRESDRARARPSAPRSGCTCEVAWPVAITRLPWRAATAAGAPAGAAAATCAAFSAFVVWPLKSRVGANSPSLWPTMFSVMYTGMNFFPLCTAIVWPTISGIDRRPARPGLDDLLLALADSSPPPSRAGGGR